MEPGLERALRTDEGRGLRRLGVDRWAHRDAGANVHDHASAFVTEDGAFFPGGFFRCQLGADGQAMEKSIPPRSVDLHSARPP